MFLMVTFREALELRPVFPEFATFSLIGLTLMILAGILWPIRKPKTRLLAGLLGTCMLGFALYRAMTALGDPWVAPILLAILLLVFYGPTIILPWYQRQREIEEAERG